MVGVKIFLKASRKAVCRKSRVSSRLSVCTRAEKVGGYLSLGKEASSMSKGRKERAADAHRQKEMACAQWTRERRS